MREYDKLLDEIIGNTGWVHRYYTFDEYSATLQAHNIEEKRPLSFLRGNRVIAHITSEAKLAKAQHELTNLKYNGLVIEPKESLSGLDIDKLRVIKDELERRLKEHVKLVIK